MKSFSSDSELHLSFSSERRLFQCGNFSIGDSALYGSIYFMENRRLQKEYEELSKLQSTDGYGVTARMVGNDLTHWKGTIRGPV